MNGTSTKAFGFYGFFRLFFGAVPFAGARRPFFFAGPLAARASPSWAASARDSDSGAAVRGKVALGTPTVT